MAEDNFFSFRHVLREPCVMCFPFLLFLLPLPLLSQDSSVHLPGDPLNQAHNCFGHVIKL